MAVLLDSPLRTAEFLAVDVETRRPRLAFGTGGLSGPALLAATLAVNSAVVQLVAAVSSLTFVLVTGVRGLLGLGPAIFLTAAAVTGAIAGRAMDRFGRRPVLIVGFLVGGTGCALTALGIGLIVVRGLVEMQPATR